MLMLPKPIRCLVLLPLLLVLLNARPTAGQPGAAPKPSRVATLRARLKTPGLPDTSRVQVYFSLIYALDDEGKATPAVRRSLLLTALRLARRIGFVGGELEALNYLGALDVQTSGPAALQYYNAAVRRARETGETRFLADSYQGMGSAAYGQREYARAAALYEQAVAAAEPLTPYYQMRTLIVALGGLSDTYLQLGRLPEASRAFRRMRALSRQRHDAVTEFLALAQWGSGVRKYQPDSAAAYLLQAAALARTLNSPYYQAFAALELMKVRQQQKRWPETLALARQTLPLARLSQTPDYEAEALGGLADALRHLGQAPAAFDTLQRAHALLDTLSSKEKRAEFARQQVVFEVGEKEARIRKLEQQRRIGQLEADRQRTRTYALLLGLLGVAAISAVLWHQRRRLQASEVRLQASEARLQAANRTKDQLIRIVGHDLRSPMASLQQLTPLLHEVIEQPERATAHALIRTLDAGAQHLGNMVDNLFQWAREQGGQLINNPEALHVAFVASSITALYGPTAMLKNIVLDTTVAPGLLVWADLGLLTAVLRNLVGNGLKFTPQNGRVLLTAQPAANGRVEISVLDTGPGLAPELLVHLRTVDRLPSTPGTAGEPGTGLGLPLSASFVRLMGGELHIGPGPDGQGTRCWFQLPGV